MLQTEFQRYFRQKQTSTPSIKVGQSLPNVTIAASVEYPGASPSFEVVI